jgi:membrane associated rhomboid family serine protease
MFLHGGVMHIISNMVFLAAFAPMVEDAMGRGRFLVFYLLGGLAATAAQIAIDQPPPYRSSGPAERLPPSWARF